MHNFELLPAPSGKVYQLSLARLERVRGLSRGGEPIELSRLNRLLAEFCRYVVEDDSGVGTGFEDVEPFVFGAVPMRDGRGVVWGDGYEVDTSLSESTGIAEIELIPVDGLVQGV